MGKEIKSNQTRGLRLISSQPVTADNQQFLIDLPRGPHLESVFLRYFGTFAVTVTGTAVRNIAAYRLLRRADFVMNSNVTMDSVSGPQLAQTYFTRRSYPTLTNPSGFAVAGGYTFDATFIFDRVLMDNVRPKDSMLKTDVGIANLQLRVQLGSLNDMFTNAATATTYTACTLECSVVDYQEQKDSQGNTPSPTFYVKRNGFSQNIAGAANGTLIKLNTGNRLRAISIRVLDPATLEPNLALVSRFGVKRAGDQRVDVTTNTLARLNSSAYGVGAGVLLTGQLVWDFANSGQLAGARYSEYWPIPSSADTFLVIDTTAAALIEAVTIEGVDL